MIQYPESGEVVVDVPGNGPLVRFHPQMNKVFGARLVDGRCVKVANRQAIEWLLPASFIKVDSTNFSHFSAQAELNRHANAAEETAQELTDLLNRNSKRDAPLRISSTLIKRLGGDGLRDHVMLETEIRPLCDAIRRTVAGVRRAIERKNFISNPDGQILLYGWAFLPPDIDLDTPTLLPATVTLVLEPEMAYGTVPAQNLSWKIDGKATSIELIRVDGADSIVQDTHEVVTLDSADGKWRFPKSDLPPGSEYVARVRGSWGSADSNRVRIPVEDKKVVPSVSEEPAIVPPAIPSRVAPPPIPVPAVVPPQRNPYPCNRLWLCRCRWKFCEFCRNFWNTLWLFLCRWFWLIASILVGLVALALLWYLLFLVFPWLRSSSSLPIIPPISTIHKTTPVPVAPSASQPICDLQMDAKGQGGVREQLIDMKDVPIQIEEGTGRKYLCFSIAYNTFEIKDRILFIATKGMNASEDIVLRSSISSIYNNLSEYLTSQPFNEPHPYFEPRIECPVGARIWDSMCASGDFQCQVKITEDHIELINVADPFYKKVRILIFGGCESGASVNDTKWKLSLQCNAHCSSNKEQDQPVKMPPSQSGPTPDSVEPVINPTPVIDSPILPPVIVSPISPNDPNTVRDIPFVKPVAKPKPFINPPAGPSPSNGSDSPNPSPLSAPDKSRDIPFVKPRKPNNPSVAGLFALIPGAGNLIVGFKEVNIWLPV